MYQISAVSLTIVRFKLRFYRFEHYKKILRGLLLQYIVLPLYVSEKFCFAFQSEGFQSASLTQLRFIKIISYQC